MRGITRREGGHEGGGRSLGRSSRPLLLTSPPFSSDCFDCVSLGADVAGGVAPRLVKRVYSCVLCCVVLC